MYDRTKIEHSYSTSFHSVYIGYYRLYIFTSLTYFVVESVGRDEIQRRVKIYSSTERLCTKLFIIQQINQGKNEFSAIYSAAFNCRFTAR